ncbi:MAG: acyl-CoA thioesterase [Cytophagales bacterium]|nr:acyl-CoA thioesterase [Cytophagales bacterium]
MRPFKHPKDSISTMTELVLPNDTNMLHNLMGGKLMHWMDIVSAISAIRHSDSVVVTASVDNISFAEPIRLGNLVELNAKVTRAFNTSMEVHIEVFARDLDSKKTFRSNSAFFTFVAMDKENRPIAVPELIPETETEKTLYEGALKRRQLRLILSGRMKPSDANELKSLFD